MPKQGRLICFCSHASSYQLNLEHENHVLETWTTISSDVSLSFFFFCLDAFSPTISRGGTCDVYEHHGVQLVSWYNSPALVPHQRYFCCCPLPTLDVQLGSCLSTCPIGWQIRRLLLAFAFSESFRVSIHPINMTWCWLFLPWPETTGQVGSLFSGWHPWPGGHGSIALNVSGLQSSPVCQDHTHLRLPIIHLQGWESWIQLSGPSDSVRWSSMLRLHQHQHQHQRQEGHEQVVP